MVPKYSKEEGQVPSAHITLKDYSITEQTVNEIIDLVNSSIQEFHRPTQYKVKDAIVKTRNNKNNFNALRIEDIAITYPGVIDARIELMNDGLYDYKLTVVASGVVDDEKKSEIIAYTKKIMLEQAVPKCSILFDIEGVKYIDSQSYYKDNNCKTYVKGV